MISFRPFITLITTAFSCCALSASFASTSASQNTLVVDGQEVEIISTVQSQTTNSAVAVSLDNLLDAKGHDAVPLENTQVTTVPVDGDTVVITTTTQSPEPIAEPDIQSKETTTQAESSPPNLPSTLTGETVQLASLNPPKTGTRERELKTRVDDLLVDVNILEKQAEPTIVEPAAPDSSPRPTPSIAVQETQEVKAPSSRASSQPKSPEIITQEPVQEKQRSAERSSAPSERGRYYPWKRNIYTTVFWVGEPPSANVPKSSCNTMSAWDTHWVRNFGGFDDPKSRNGFFPARFKPKQNPFYFALPFNDMRNGRHKPISKKVIPWFQDEFVAANVSVCKSRWIAIRYRGRTVYAQWEDVGPFEHDHPEYVFGKARPRSNQNKSAGLDISPAARDYLGISGLCLTDWKFVDDNEVPPGPWKKIVNIRSSVMAKLEALRRTNTNQSNN